ncbi:phospholipid-transporting ATPase ABCA3-like [Portunus trituberculatus]|uniref:phospholipid-transporting ATPase ABCA3-like n=1 Tax=Portunus trituberculatus TaxID=210409 RepID=UPI001E1CE883|nr:phospholipid-transporting ATPase ABCA3-like [Portunus trituberculatus]XP_045131523.1 phospholipid-transporting ATPase ABCA3-like [Portunus trituberculatus]XP_045131524.1 phospholipid-transporting ATPase ABCA3-like [Portunus trituberculatus]XP_045131525.1 phospholipid-transporting ATPase ABCA3-like [Portunus trituberculatus]XP_045131526.1 phospholipid-transporting ATPase ABCA3-like [Portunus trituberculatus]
MGSTAAPVHKRRRTVGRHLLLLLWKSLLLRKKQKVLTFFEIFLPTALFSVILFIRLLPGSALTPVYVNKTTYFSHINEQDLEKQYLKYNPAILKPSMYYAPNESFAADTAVYLADRLGWPANAVVAVNDLDEMDELVEQKYYSSNGSSSSVIGLHFKDMPNDCDVPETLHYSIRLPGTWYTGAEYPFFQLPGPRNRSRSYINNGFALLQTWIDRFYISRLTNDTRYMDEFQLDIQPYPYPPYSNDGGLSQAYGSMLPSYMILAFVLLSPSLIKNVVHEKETGVRELMRLMGMNRWLMWLGWFLHALVVVLLVSSIVTIMLTVSLHQSEGSVPPIINYTDPSFVWVMNTLYGICSIAFCLAISTFFSRPTLATTLGVLIWLFSYYIPNTFFYFDYDDMSLAPKVLVCLFPNMAMTLSFRVMAMFEGRALGVQWDTIWETGNPRDELTPGAILLMMVLDTFLYLLLVWYVDQISPGKYGVPLPFYFPFQRSYWCGTQPESVTSSTSDSDDPTSHYFEEEPEGLRPGIVIRNLRKEFRTLGGKVKVAVEDVSMTCYEGQCTVLLGHNGAGKTTTMSILTGVYAPSGGQAEVGGWNIATHLREAREELGLCPQHNMLFVDLTVLQHLLFFGRLKGLTTKAAEEEAVELLGRLDLLDKKNMFGSQLSGGMKRKLSLAISLIGGSKVVILDEPSSGLDPESRRWVWDVVQGERGRRTILVTTHHMEEADVLGDRVAIMASGRVVCAGSTLFLKNMFGDGYTLEIIMTEDCNVDKLKEEVNRHMPSAVLLSIQGGEVAFKLSPDTSLFAPLVNSLSSRKEDLGIRHFGLSLTTMEKVFLSVSTVMEKDEEHQQTVIPLDEDEHTQHRDSVNKENGDFSGSKDHLSDGDWRKLTGTTLTLHRTKAFFIKRIIYSMRKWPLFITQGLVPVVVTIACLLVDRNFNFFLAQEPLLTLTPSIFPKTFSFVSADENLTDLSSHYKDLFTSKHEVEETKNLTTSLLQAANESLSRYREQHTFSASFLDTIDNITLQVWSQTIPFHTVGIGINLVSNALLRYATNSTNNTITTDNYPLPPNTMWQFKTELSASSFIYPSMMSLALAFLSASYLVFPLQERESNTKQVQLMTGAPVWILWTTNFIWDMGTYIVTTVLILIAFMTLDPRGYFTIDAAPGALVLLLLLYGWGSIPLAYLFSFPFQTPAAGFAVLTFICIVAGQLITAVVAGLRLAQDPSLDLASDIIHWISCLFPAYPVADGFSKIVSTSVHNTKCDKFDETTMLELCLGLFIGDRDSEFLQCCPHIFCSASATGECFQVHSYFNFDHSGLGSTLLILFVDGLIFMALIGLIEAGVGRKFLHWWRSCRISRLPAIVDPWDTVMPDNDVVAEVNLVGSLMCADHGNLELTEASKDTTMLVHNLVKQYSGCLVRAVRGISFHVDRGECFGLLGVNGAGKTSTFKMLTGDEIITGGDARIGAFSLRRHRKKFLQQIGYCPQFDAFMGDLTGVEMLQLMGRLRGMDERHLKTTVPNLVDRVGLTECALRPSSTYSGGNRRKLSTAMALIGDPPLVFLDEPTSGVDPASRRRVWAAISEAVSSGQSVVLTSHSMEECEALCSRITIMSRGSLRCVGSSSHLKAKFGQGYSLQVKLKTHGFSTASKEDNDRIYDVKVEEVKTVINYHLPGSSLTDQHKGMLAYRVPDTVTWGTLFAVMESLKAGQHPDGSQTTVSQSMSSPSIVEVYAASDTSLEQVFLSFAREAAQLRSMGLAASHVVPTMVTAPSQAVPAVVTEHSQEPQTMVTEL